MRRYLALWLGMFLLSGIAAMAQVASGNVAESSNPHADIINAQNFRQRTIEGCVVQQGSDYLLVPRHGRPEELKSDSSDTLSQNVGRQVRVVGRESFAGEGANLAADFTVAVDQIQVVAQSCPAGWNGKWVKP